jgi:hypothetical protein
MLSLHEPKHDSPLSLESCHRQQCQNDPRGVAGGGVAMTMQCGPSKAQINSAALAGIGKLFAEIILK